LSYSKDINPNGIQVGDRIRLIHTHDIHADVKEGDTGTVIGLSTIPKGSQINELDLIIWIEWDRSKSRVALTERVDEYEIIEKVSEDIKKQK
jgi:ribosomal protein L2